MVLNLARPISGFFFFLLSDLLTALRGVGHRCGMCSYQALIGSRTLERKLVVKVQITGPGQRFCVLRLYNQKPSHLRPKWQAEPQDLDSDRDSGIGGVRKVKASRMGRN